MAAPITHIVLADKIFDKHFNHMDRKGFYVGTSFPDIRYLGVIERKKTHFGDLLLETIKKEEAFMAGVMFHSFLDEVREKYVVSKGLYAEIPDSKYVTQSLKLLEDRNLYEKVTNWKVFRGYFEEVSEEALSLRVSREDVTRWNKLLVRYFSKQPDEESVTTFVNDIGRPSEMSQEINRVVSEISNNEKVLDAIEELYSSFEELLL